ncbi:MAG: hypothetical protein LBI01_01060, partial [Elusimicrobium sp.]|nr:hypothetical protein [Elusimicrobium sp.]
MDSDGSIKKLLTKIISAVIITSLLPFDAAAQVYAPSSTGGRALKTTIKQVNEFSSSTLGAYGLGARVTVPLVSREEVAKGLNPFKSGGGLTGAMERGREAYAKGYYVAKAKEWIREDWKYRELEGAVKMLLSGQRAGSGEVCRDEGGYECIREDIFAEGGLELGLELYGYNNGKSIVETSGEIMWLVRNYNFSKANREAAAKYFRDVINEWGSNCGGSFKDMLPEGSVASKWTVVEGGRREKGKECVKVTDAVYGLGLVSNSGSDARLVKEFIWKYYTKGAGSVVAQYGVMSLMSMDTEESYGIIKKFLLEDSLYEGEHVNGILDILFNKVLGTATPSGVTGLAIGGVNAVRGGSGRYLNSVTEKFEYADEEECKAQGYGAGQCELLKDERIQVATRNVFEDIGKLISENGSERSRKLEREILLQGKRAISINAAARNVSDDIHMPLLVGVVTGAQGEELSEVGYYETLKKLAESDYWDINEGTQRSLKRKIFKAIRYELKDTSYFIDTGRDDKKIERYIKNARALGLGASGDLVMMSLVVLSLVNLAMGMKQVAGAYMQLGKLNRARVAALAGKGRLGTLEAVRAGQNTQAGVRAAAVRSGVMSPMSTVTMPEVAAGMSDVKKVGLAAKFAKASGAVNAERRALSAQRLNGLRGEEAAGYNNMSEGHSVLSTQKPLGPRPVSPRTEQINLKELKVDPSYKNVVFDNAVGES